MKLKKEIILIIGISVFIIVLELVTNKITNECVKNVEDKIKIVNVNLNKIKDMEKDNEEYKMCRKDLEENIQKLKKDWFLKEDKLSIFSEHDELVKVSKCLITIEENVKNEEYENALEDGSEFMYWLNHIKEKDKLELKNVF